MCSAAEPQGLTCSKDQVLALGKFACSLSMQLLSRRSFLKNQSHFLFFSGVSCPSENFQFSCFILSLPVLFPKHFLTPVKSASFFFSQLAVTLGFTRRLWIDFGCFIPDANNSLSLPSEALQVWTRRLHGGGKRKAALHWHYRNQEISCFQTALCNSSTMKLEEEVEGERRRKGSVLPFVLDLWSTLHLQFNNNEITLWTLADFRLQPPKFWKASLKLSHQSWQECVIATATT